MRKLNIRIIGLDTSHAIAFTSLLNDPANPHHIKGGEVILACPAGSPDFIRSYSRIEKITKEVELFGVRLVETIEEAAVQSDAILLESADGRVHLDQVKQLTSFNKPVFVDKPFCLSSAEALEMINISEQFGMPLMSSSALRFAEELRQAVLIKGKGKIIGADCYGPMEFVDVQTGYFWYGIHTIEMLYAILGCGAQHVTSITTDESDVIVSEWKDGRIGTIRGNRRGNTEFGAVIHFEKGIHHVSISSSSIAFYASLLEEIILFFNSRQSRIPLSETLEIMKFIEAANESKKVRKKVFL